MIIIFIGKYVLLKIYFERRDNEGNSFIKYFILKRCV